MLLRRKLRRILLILGIILLCLAVYVIAITLNTSIAISEIAYIGVIKNIAMILIIAIAVLAVLLMIVNAFSRLRGRMNFGLFRMLRNIASFEDDNSNAKSIREVVETSKENTKEVYDIEKEIQKHDSMFSKDKFLSWAKSVFIVVQTSITSRDASKLAMYESKELFNQHTARIQESIRNRQINVNSDINITNAQLVDYSKTVTEEVLQVSMMVSMLSYVMEEDSKKVISGSRTSKNLSKVTMIFKRKFGETLSTSNDVNIKQNCPNCGAPTQITEDGRCEFCSTIMIDNAYSWVLIDLK